MKPLTVYKASAGSGKTFTLAVEYIKLLIDNPACFKNILAVTFTNKATEEMKLRILSQLYGIWKALPDSHTYMSAVCASLGISERQASQRAGTALSLLIHNYHYFRVETIDSFFQSVLRNLARELDLTSNLRIGLNDTQVEEQAVDLLIESLNSTSTMLQWLISYIFSNISENKGWNVIGQVKKFGRTIFRDFYKAVSDDLGKTLSDQDFFDNYTKQLRSIRSNAKKLMAGYAQEFEKITAEAGLSPTSYAKKSSGICSYFNKLKSYDFSDTNCKKQILEKCLANAEDWASKTSPDRDVIIQLAESRLMPLLHKAEEDRPKQWTLYATADCTLKHLDKLRLLGSIEAKVRELNSEANRFLLSDTQHLLHTLIKDSDTPFIFEKVGCRLEHIMIDEFQDTSAVQWDNFKVLLKECMSHSDESSQLVNNLIVGDVKQSIYRWRAGDWRLLGGINRQLGKQGSSLEVKTLQTNYRSERNVIEFNNCFFKAAAEAEYSQEKETCGETLAGELLSAYADVSQTARGGNGGYVSITLLPQSESYEQDTLQQTADRIKELLTNGAKPTDIAVIVRYNRHIPLIADYLSENMPELDIVSDEAFRLDASPAVNMLIQALILLVHPEDALTKATLAINYQKAILRTPAGHGDLLTPTAGSTNNLDQLLPKEYSDNMEKLVCIPLSEAIDCIYNAFKIERLNGQSAYICAFYDKVTDFAANNPGNIEKFIEAWHDEICSSTVQSDAVTGLRLISIHKSKGLEFAHVIIPFCDWTLESRDTTLWCQPGTQPFNELPIVPVDYSKKLLDTIYADNFRDEHMQNRVDNLNLLYVAFTRAGRSLYVIGRKGKSRGGQANRSELLEQCLPIVAQRLDGSLLCGDGEDDKPSTLEYGTPITAESRSKQNKQTATDNVFLMPSERYEASMDASHFTAQFKQSNKSRDFISGGESRRSQYIEAGNVMHKLFSTIRITDDIAPALKQMEFDGIIYDDNLTAEKLRGFLAERFNDEQVKDWFSPRWRVFNECSILEYDKNTGKTIERRPDRVITDGTQTIVIDFKFGKPQKAHAAQVAEYADLLRRMEHTNVKGFVWYVMENKICKIQ